MAKNVLNNYISIRNINEDNLTDSNSFEQVSVGSFEEGTQIKNIKFNDIIKGIQFDKDSPLKKAALIA